MKNHATGDSVPEGLDQSREDALFAEILRLRTIVAWIPKESCHEHDHPLSHPDDPWVEHAYLDLGADMLKLCSPPSIDELVSKGVPETTVKP